jgi:DNA invertase Pin-like site-specific DNA recombinase
VPAGPPSTVYGFVGVSRRGGREGESFISPEVQRQRIEGWATANNAHILEWWEEIDESGARRDRPLFQQALERCERGETGGIVVAKLDRFARSAVDALESIKRLNDAGARLVSVEDGFDGSTAMGRFAIGILTLIAELELERIKDNWDAAVTNAIKRGVYISAHVPAGYRRDENGRLVPDERTAPVIAEAFRLRALGTSYTKIAAFLEEQGVVTEGSRNWSNPGVTHLLKNPAYLGQARSGKAVNENAHEPIVTRAEFDAAQGVYTRLEARPGSPAEMAMLGGLARCAACGHTLKIAGTANKKTGKRYPTYYCSGRYASGLCPARATLVASRLDPYVEAQVLTALRAEDGFLAEAAEASDQLEAASRSLQTAEHELELYVTDPQLLTALGRDMFLQGAQARQAAVDSAREEVTRLRSQSTLPDELLSGDLLQAWPQFTTQEKRQLLHGLLEHVLVTRDDNSRKKDIALPLSERVQIVLKGGTTLPHAHLPQEGS